MAQKKQENKLQGRGLGFRGFLESTDGMKAGDQPASGDLNARLAEAATSAAAPPPIPIGEKAGPSGEKTGRDTVKSAQNEPKVSRSSKSFDAKSAPATGSATSSPINALKPDEGEATASRREARRRPAGPVRERFAANDDVPSIGGLIYALQQKPSTEAFRYATIASVVWALIGLTFGWLALSPDISSGVDLTLLLSKPTTFLTLTAIVMPIAIIWFLAVLAWRAEELRLRSSTMTEVAVRLAEPDRLAEQSVASLGQAVRRQVSFMNDAVSRSLGRAGELEALVHNEVAALERSYEENERKIRGLINELADERHALSGVGGDFADNIRAMSKEVPALIEKLSNQQSKLTGIISSAGDNLTTLESSLATTAQRIGNSLGSKTEELQAVFEDFTGSLDSNLGSQTDKMQTVLGERSEEIRNLLGDYTSALATALGNRSEQIENAFNQNLERLDKSIGQRTDNLQIVFEEYGKALDSTLAHRADALDSQLIERTRALDDAFNQRLQLFDDSIMRSTQAIDQAVGEKALALTTALDSHSKSFRETISQQASDLDESLVHGINAVRRSSENITRQSLKAIEGLAGQSDLLKGVSENLLEQINSVSNRFDKQSQTIMSAASAMESANYKIDSTLRTRHSELSNTLDRMSGKADEFGKFIEGYSTNIEGSLGDAEKRARAAAEEFRTSAQTQQRVMLADFDKLRADADLQSNRALEDLRQRFASVSHEFTNQLGSITASVEGSTDDLREKTARAASEIAREQERLKAQLAAIPTVTREGSDTMRRALQDQLKALDRLSELSKNQAKNIDVRPPVSSASPVGVSSPGNTGVGGANTGALKPPSRGLSSLSSSVAKEIASRTSTQQSALRRSSPEPAGISSGATAAPPSAAAPQGAGHSGSSLTDSGDSSQNQWSLNDLLQRASFNDDDDAGPGAEMPEPLTPQPTPSAPRSRPSAPNPSQQPSGGRTNEKIDLAQLARSLSPGVAAQVWERLRTGQRGFLSKDIYTPEGRIVFDDISYRFQRDGDVKKTVLAFLSNFERTLREAENTDSSTQQMQARLTSELGRVYLFLAHVSGRLS